jgi:hypothetical protein
MFDVFRIRVAMYSLMFYNVHRIEYKQLTKE